MTEPKCDCGDSGTCKSGCPRYEQKVSSQELRTFDAPWQEFVAREQRAKIEADRILYLAAPETLHAHGVWYDRRDTVDALTSLLADARKPRLTDEEMCDRIQAVAVKWRIGLAEQCVRDMVAYLREG